MPVNTSAEVSVWTYQRLEETCLLVIPSMHFIASAIVPQIVVRAVVRSFTCTAHEILVDLLSHPYIKGSFYLSHFSDSLSLC